MFSLESIGLAIALSLLIAVATVMLASNIGCPNHY